MEIVRTYFAPSETRGDKPPTDRIFELPPKNLKKYRLEPHFVKENFWGNEENKMSESLEPTEETNEQDENSVAEDVEIRNLVYRGWQKVSRKISTPEYIQARREYLETCVEKPYQQFLAECGPVNGTNLREYLLSFRNFENFLEKQGNLSGGQHYDLGRRFCIDALLNGDTSITGEEQLYFRNFLTEIAPYYGHEPRAIDGSYQHFLDNYPGSEKILDSLSHLFKKAQKQNWITTPINVWAGVKGSFQPEDRDRLLEWKEFILSSSEDYNQAQKGPISDATYNSSLLFPMSWLLRKIPGGEERLKKAYDEFPNEFFREAEDNFGCDFRPPE